jgi:hypothetical protein
MSMMQRPIVGTWYVNPTGMMFKVRMLGYSLTGPTNVVIEYVEGTTQVVSIQDWQSLDVDVHSRMPAYGPQRADLPSH